MTPLTPKQAFLAGPHANAFGEFAVTPAFREAVNAALLQTIADSSTRTTTLEEACRQNYELQGARKFALTLAALATPDDNRQPPTPNANLQWQPKPTLQTVPQPLPQAPRPQPRPRPHK